MFDTPGPTLRELTGPAIAAAPGREPPAHAERLTAAQRWLQDGPDRQLLTPGDSAYPPLLLQVADPPLQL